MIIGIDLGNLETKTPQRSFRSALTKHSAQPLSTELIAYEGSFWTLSGDRIPYMRNKTTDQRFFILALFAIAKELTRKDSASLITEVDLALGLPPEHMGDMRDSLVSYFKSNRQLHFSYNDTPLAIFIRNVFVYPQGYAAMATHRTPLISSPMLYLADIGGMTTDVILLRSGKPDFSRSLEPGIIALHNTLVGRICAQHDMTVEAEHIDAVLQGRETILPDDVQQTIREAAGVFADGILEKLRDIHVDLRANPVIFMGGGAILLKEQLETSPMVAKSEFILNANANAAAYELLAQEELRRMELRNA